MLPLEPREAGQVAAIRNYTIHSGGKRYKIYRGDLYRHTDISLDGSGDGSLYDAFRYMMDAAAMDFFLVTDHKGTSDTKYNWWRTEKAEDMFHVPGRFVTLFGYERRFGFPMGWNTPSPKWRTVRQRRRVRCRSNWLTATGSSTSCT